MQPNLQAFEHRARLRGYTRIAGIDEAGRGPLAGPVVSAAVWLPPDFDIAGITDSKQLTPRRRDALFARITDGAASVGIGMVEAAEIDRINILQAALRSMAMAVEKLDPPPDYLLIDGNQTIPSDVDQQAIPKGDQLSVSIAAASIVAKVTRDRLMADFHRQYPQFGFDRHKGYPTRAHKDAIRRYGPCPIHRVSFRGVREYHPSQHR